MILVICEKNQIADAIMDILPGAKQRDGELTTKGNYCFAALGGHALTLKEPEEIDRKYEGKWSLDQLPVFFEPWAKKPISGKSQKIAQIKNKLKSCEYVINAGDNDDEGQLLVDEVLEYCGYTGTVKRLDTADMSEGKLRKKFYELQDNRKWEPMGRSALARQISDKTFGYTMTRYFTLNNSSGVIVNVGRVKTPTLGMVVAREKAITGHITTPYYTMTAATELSGKPIDLNLVFDKDSDLLQDGLITDKHVLVDIANRIKAKEFTGSLSFNEAKETAPLPFNLNELNKYCSKKWQYSPSEVMIITQSLRDDYKAITYNRTDCQYLSEEHYKEAPDTAKTALANLGASYCLDFSIHSKAFNDANISAHHGIIPTNNSFDISKLSVKQRNVYEAICLRYFIQFMPPCIKERAEFLSSVDDTLDLKAVASRIKDAGYRALFQADDISADSDANENENTPVLFDLESGTYKFTILGTNIAEKQTKPPQRYTEATLQDDMSRVAKYVTDPKLKEILKQKDDGKKGEHGSIGTTATRPHIVADLIKQGYIDVKSNKLYATQKAIDLIEQLPDEVILADTTAKWWIYQEKISAGQGVVSDLTNAVLDTMRSVMTGTQTVSVGSKTQKKPIANCPLCGKPVYESDKKFGCSDWQHCDFKIWKNIAGKKLTANQAKDLIEKGHTSKLKGFTSKAGKKFEAMLVLSSDKIKVEFKFD